MIVDRFGLFKHPPISRLRPGAVSILIDRLASVEPTRGTHVKNLHFKLEAKSKCFDSEDIFLLYFYLELRFVFGEKFSSDGTLAGQILTSITVIEIEIN